MTPTLLRDIGESLYGARWQSELSRDLAVSDRTMRRWIAGTRAMPDTLHDDLRSLVQARLGALGKAMVRLR